MTNLSDQKPADTVAIGNNDEMTPIATSECLQIQPSQFAADYEEISRIHFFKFQNIFFT